MLLCTSETLLGVMSASLLLITIMLVVIFVLLIRHYRRNPPVQGNGSSRSAEQDSYEDALRNPGHRPQHRVWRTVVSVSR